MSSLERRSDYFVGGFEAMASHCEVLIDTHSESLAHDITQLAAKEVTRIEQKYSRYRDDNILHQINSGAATEVDAETAQLLDYAQQLFQLSEGLFDVSSGVLRRVWHFDGSDNIPPAAEVDALLPFIGWDKTHWNKPVIQLGEGMEIDFGGIGKEYAADRAALSIGNFLAGLSSKPARNTSILVNLGGDLAIIGPRANSEGWRVAIDARAQNSSSQISDFSIKHGGVATSGDANRYLEKDGVRYSHVLDPRTGWPVSGAPSAVTVVAATCTDAGMLSTLALLHGAEAEHFLQEQDVVYWCCW